MHGMLDVHRAGTGAQQDPPHPQDPPSRTRRGPTGPQLLHGCTERRGTVSSRTVPLRRRSQPRPHPGAPHHPTPSPRDGSAPQPHRQPPKRRHHFRTKPTPTLIWGHATPSAGCQHPTQHPTTSHPNVPTASHPTASHPTASHPTASHPTSPCGDTTNPCGHAMMLLGTTSPWDGCVPLGWLCPHGVAVSPWDGRVPMGWPCPCGGTGTGMWKPYRSGLLVGRVAGQRDEIFQWVLRVEMRRVPDGRVGEIGGGRLGENGGGGEMQRGRRVRAASDTCGWNRDEGWRGGRRHREPTGVPCDPTGVPCRPMGVPCRPPAPHTPGLTAVHRDDGTVVLREAAQAGRGVLRRGAVEGRFVHLCLHVGGDACGAGGGGVRGRAPHGNGVLWGVRVCVKQHGGVQQWCAAVRTGFALVQLCVCVCVCTDLCACATPGMRLGTRVRAWMCSSTSVCARLCADLRVSEHTTHVRQHVVVWVCSACTLRARALCVHEHIHGAGLAPSPRCSGHPQSPNVGQDVGLTAASPKHGGGWLR